MSKEAEGVARKVLDAHLRQQCVLWQSGEPCAACDSRIADVAAIIDAAFTEVRREQREVDAKKGDAKVAELMEAWRRARTKTEIHMAETAIVNVENVAAAIRKGDSK